MKEKKSHKKQHHTLLESHPLIYTWGTIRIFKQQGEQYFIKIEGQPDRGAPFTEQWKIQPSDYACFKNPSVKSLKRMLGRRFFEATLWDVFLKTPRHLELLKEILEEERLPKIENSSVKAWFEKEKRMQRAKSLFQAAPSLGIFEMPSYVHATSFISNDLLEVDVIEEGENELMIRKCVFDISKGEITSSKVISMYEGLPFFKFAKDYPIEPIHFGSPDLYRAHVYGQDSLRKKAKLIISNMDGKDIFSHEYPKSSNLGRFYNFDQAQSLRMKNSVLFMYSFRDYNLEDDYYVMRFEVEDGKVLAKTQVQTKGDSTISFSTEGRMAFSKMESNGCRAKAIEIVQL